VCEKIVYFLLSTSAECVEKRDGEIDRPVSPVIMINVLRVKIPA
jgi:hypothetical protein